MKRTVIKIDESRCIGCGACVKSCHGGALEIIDGKARIINEMYCDGLGACIGTCPSGALTLEEREVEKQKATEQKVAPHHEQHQCSALPQMNNFPIQLRLVNPNAPYLQNRELVLAADCTAFIYSDFHGQFLKNNSVIIACPKLDNAKELYVEKLTAIIDNSSANTLTVIIMEVPCCNGLLQMAQEAQANAKRKIAIKKIVIKINGNIQTG